MERSDSVGNPDHCLDRDLVIPYSQVSVGRAGGREEAQLELFAG